MLLSDVEIPMWLWQAPSERCMLGGYVLPRLPRKIALSSLPLAYETHDSIQMGPADLGIANFRLDRQLLDLARYTDGPTLHSYTTLLV